MPLLVMMFGRAPEVGPTSPTFKWDSTMQVVLPRKTAAATQRHRREEAFRCPVRLLINLAISSKSLRVDAPKAPSVSMPIGRKVTRSSYLTSFLTSAAAARRLVREWTPLIAQGACVYYCNVPCHREPAFERHHRHTVWSLAVGPCEFSGLQHAHVTSLIQRWSNFFVESFVLRAASNASVAA